VADETVAKKVCVKVTVDLSDFTAGVKKMTAQLSQMSGQAESSGNSTEESMRRMTASITKSLGSTQQELTASTKRLEQAVTQIIQKMDNLNVKTTKTSKTTKNAGDEAKSTAQKFIDMADGTRIADQQIANLSDELVMLKQQKRALESIGFGLGFSDYDEVVAQIASIEQALKGYKAQLLSTLRQTESAGTPIQWSQSLQPLQAVGSTVLKGVSSVIQWIRGIGSGARSSTSGVEGLVRSIRNIGVVSVGLRLVSGLFGRLRSIVSSYVSSNETLNATVERLKNGLGQALAPAINLVTNAMSKLLPYIVGIADAVASLITNLFGTGWTSVSTSAGNAADAVGDVADATEDATAAQEAYNRTVAGFDEITKLDSSSSSGGSGGSGGSGNGASTSTTDGGEGIVGILPEWLRNLAEQIQGLVANQDFTGIGALLAAKFGDLIDSADAKLTDSEFQSKVAAMTDHVADILNGFFGKMTYSDGTKQSIATRTGDLVGDAISLALNTIDRFLTRVKWDKIGETVAQGVNGAIESLNENDIKFGTILADLLNAGIAGLDGFAVNVKWSEVGQFVADNINSFFTTTDWKDVGKTASDLILGLGEFLSSAINGIDQESIVQAFIDLLSGIDWLKVITGAAEAVTSVFSLDPILSSMIPPDWSTSVKVNVDGSSWSNFVENFKKNSNVQAAVSLVKNGWTTVCDWVKTNLGGLVEKGVGLARSAWSTVSEWVKTNIGGKVDKGIGLIQNGWSTISGWVSKKLGAAISFAIGLKKNWTGTVAKALGLDKLAAKFSIKLPKVSVTWSGTPIALPHFKVTWNAKGAILNGAQLFGMAGNTLLGGGEAGREAVLPLESNTGWMDKIADKVVSRMGSSEGEQTINVTVTLDRQVVGKTVVKYINGERNRTGKSPVLI
jgi:hypothetical protein